jgi:uncharacterized membrane protein YhaH (DUF805 family)
MNLKKYFDFSGTINGTTYFLRNALSGIIGFIGGYLIGLGIYDEDYGLISLGLVVAAPAIAFQVSTVYKRIKALFPDNVMELTVSFVVVSVLSQFAKGGDFQPLMTLVIFVIACILIFKNSKIETHNG